MTVICMSQAELNRLTVVMDFAEGRLTARQTAQMLRMTERQAWRLLRRFRQDGAPGLVSRKRGRPSNRRHHPALQETVMALVRTHYPDFGPTLASEKLAERHDLHVGRETLRKWMMAAGLWKDRVTQAAVVENKRLSTALAYVAQIQQERDEKRSAKAPRRRGQGDRHMFKAY
jgi:hypothetical protein